VEDADEGDVAAGGQPPATPDPPLGVQ
jgi:hypothetical protein